MLARLTHAARAEIEARRPVLAERLARLRKRSEPLIRSSDGRRGTAVDSYWEGHTVHATPFLTRAESLQQLEWRFEQYPLFRELTGLWGEHDGETILDYGCGPGNDLTGLAVHTEAARLIGMDVSSAALGLAAKRLALHRVPRERVELVQLSDSRTEVPLEDRSVDFVNCQGVLHHTSAPEAILRELRRVLRPGGRGCVMVYNRDSVWFHLYTAYERMIVEGAFPGLSVEQAFTRNTDGEQCPISRAYVPQRFVELCRDAGFEAEFVGGYASQRELASLRDSLARALADERLADEHRDFLRDLSFDADGLPVHDGSYAGIGGVYRLKRPEDEPGPSR